MRALAPIAGIVVLAVLLVALGGPRVLSQAESRFFPTPTATPLPTPTPLPPVACEEATSLVLQAHPSIFGEMQSDMRLTLTCGTDVTNRDRSVYLTWVWAGERHFAEYSVSPTREVTPRDVNAHYFETYTGNGMSISAVMKYFK